MLQTMLNQLRSSQGTDLEEGDASALVEDEILVYE